MRITEQSNPITQHIDRVTAHERGLLLYEAEREIFSKTALFHPNFLFQLETLRLKVRDCLGRNGLLIMGGAGTSGRLAMLNKYRLNSGIKNQVISLLAGGPDAFFRAKENVEDSPLAGIQAFPETGDRPFIYLGISCGLSAAYVAGQLHHALEKKAEQVVLLGFNRLEDASARVLPGINTSLDKIINSNEVLLLNPLLGPEPITGSTRMKGGTATRIIIAALLANLPVEETITAASDLHQRFKQQVLKADLLSERLEQAHRGFLNGRPIVYWGDEQTTGAAMLDASECPPTFGTLADQVQVWSEPSAKPIFREIQDLSYISQTSLDLKFPKDQAEVFPIRLFQDTVYGKPCLGFGFPQPFHSALNVPFQDLWLKWWLNTFSTALFTGLGKVHGNLMIDLRVSNLKLWDRAVRMISVLSRCDPAAAENAMLAELGISPSCSASQRIVASVACDRLVGKSVLRLLRLDSKENRRLLASGSPLRFWLSGSGF